MLKFLTELLKFKSKEPIKSPNLRDQMNITFEEKLIDLDFDNVGTYHKGSRTKLSKNDK